MAKVLIPGGFGFIGSYLTRACLQRGDEVTVISLQKKNPSIPFDASHVRCINLDLRDQAAAQRLLKEVRPQLVFNLSGYIDHTPFFKGGRQVLDQHFSALLNLLESIDRSDLELFVQTGSSDEYGATPGPQKEDIREAPIAPYSYGKVAATHFIQTLARTENFPGVAVRFFLAYGPGQDARRFVPQIIRGCLSGKPFPSSQGIQLRDFTYVEDLAEGLLLLEKTPEVIGKVINLASGQPLAVRDVIDQIAKLCGQGQPQYGAVPYRSGENMHLVADVSLAKQLLGWSPKTPLQKGLEQTVSYFRQSAAV